MTEGDRESEYATAIREYLERVSQHSPGAEEYLERGSLRTVEPLTEGEREEAERLIDLHNLGMKQCWWNCQLVAGADPEFQYVEGYTISDTAPVPIHHAWVEKNGKVWELTMTDGPDPPENAVYFGVPIDMDTVNEQVAELEKAYPILGDGPHQR